MARAALLARLTWQRATVQKVTHESATASTPALSVAEWGGHQPGQHLDLRLTAQDGHTAQRPYSIGSAPAVGTLGLTVEATLGGEVSPFLAQMARPGVAVEVRGLLGGWFLWDQEQMGPVQLIGGGSGVVPLMSMLRTHRAISHPSPMWLLYSVRAPASILYRAELLFDRPRLGDGVTLVYARVAPGQQTRTARRIDALDVDALTIPANENPLCFVCRPTPFIETINALLVRAGHDPLRIRTERFGAGRP